MLVVWLLRAWPILVIFIVFAAHMLLLKAFPQSSKSVNETASLLSQIIGGLLVLHSVNSAIGLVNKGSLGSIFRNYISEFPFLRRSVTVYASASSAVGISGEARLNAIRRPTTVEERLDYLEEQIIGVRQEISAEIAKVELHIGQVAKETAAGIHSNARDIGRIRDTLEKSAIGGISEQVFGVLLVLYGSVAGYVT